MLTALALARKGHFAPTWTLLERDGLLDPHDAIRWFIDGQTMAGWLVTQLTEIRGDYLREQRKARHGTPRATTGKPTGRSAPSAVSARTKPVTMAVETPPYARPAAPGGIPRPGVRVR
ncbi:MAG: hypothetical protein EON48_09525 [Acetobacteraceae bacterium]|nr:MAG: hypothetical protein EON48_09525 [Acetobacteraceae bacterium]